MPRLNYNELKLQRIKRTEHTHGGWQLELLTQGLAVLDYDTNTEEFIVYNLAAIETISTQEARQLAQKEL